MIKKEQGGTYYNSFKNILIAVDGSREAEWAFNKHGVADATMRS